MIRFSSLHFLTILPFSLKISRKITAFSISSNLMTASVSLFPTNTWSHKMTNHQFGTSTIPEQLILIESPQNTSNSSWTDGSRGTNRQHLLAETIYRAAIQPAKKYRTTHCLLRDRYVLSGTSWWYRLPDRYAGTEDLYLCTMSSTTVGCGSVTIRS